MTPDDLTLKPCLRCHANVCVKLDMCVGCTYVHAVEVAEGYLDLGRYLAKWARFQEWESGVAA